MSLFYKIIHFPPKPHIILRYWCKKYPLKYKGLRHFNAWWYMLCGPHYIAVKRKSHYKYAHYFYHINKWASKNMQQLLYVPSNVLSFPRSLGDYQEESPLILIFQKIGRKGLNNFYFSFMMIFKLDYCNPMTVSAKLLSNLSWFHFGKLELLTNFS